MGKKKPQEYTTIKLPDKLVEELVDALLDVPHLGFSSRTEVVKAAVREYYEKMVDKKIIPPKTT